MAVALELLKFENENRFGTLIRDVTKQKRTHKVSYYSVRQCVSSSLAVTCISIKIGLNDFFSLFYYY